MIIRDAAADDAEQILLIYGPIVEQTAISFEMCAPSIDEMQRRIGESNERWPWIVIEENGELCGYAYARPFRSREAYQFSAETTIYVNPRWQNQGVGSQLMKHLLSRLHSIGHHQAIAGVTLPNAGSVTLHERLGFTLIGIFPEVGRKFDTWHDVGFWSLKLSDVDQAG